MAARRVLIAWDLGGHLGHLARLLPIATQLRSQGVAVLWVVRNLAEAAAVLGTDTWPLVQAPLPAARPGSQRAATCHADVLLLDGFADTQNLLARLAAWHSLFKLFQPDAVLADYAPLAIYAAQTAGIHVVPIGHGFEIPPVQAPLLPSFQPWNADHQEIRQRAEQALQQALEKLASTTPLRGRAAPQNLPSLYPPAQSALCIHPALDHFPRAGGRYTGPLWADLGTPPDSATPQWPASRSGPKVLCYLHPHGVSLDLLFQLLVKSHCNVLLLSPRLAAPAANLAAGWGLRVVTQPLPITPLVQQADAVITHGGMGLVALALSQAKPLLLLPETAEQLILSRRLVSQQLAQATTRNQHKATLATQLDALLSLGAASPALQAYAKIHAAHSLQTATQAVVDLLHATGIKRF